MTSVVSLVANIGPVQKSVPYLCKNLFVLNLYSSVSQCRCISRRNPWTMIGDQNHLALKTKPVGWLTWYHHEVHCLSHFHVYFKGWILEQTRDPIICHLRTETRWAPWWASMQHGITIYTIWTCSLYFWFLLHFRLHFFSFSNAQVIASPSQRPPTQPPINTTEDGWMLNKTWENTTWFGKLK